METVSLDLAIIAVTATYFLGLFLGFGLAKLIYKNGKQ